MTSPLRLPLALAGALLALGFSCTPSDPNLPDADAGETADAGVGEDAGGSPDGGAAGCRQGSPLAPPCCNVSGARVMSATCAADGEEWTCDEGALCECAGEPASFVCSDGCGSDAFIDPTCEAGGWTCGSLVATNTCPADTCWGMPGDCCVNPTCEDRRWTCESILDPCE